jgi:N-acetylmuramoyl-L-alanine amidase
LKEKNIVLSIGHTLGELLAQKNIEVVFTRMTDIYLSLSERTRITNQLHPDLFISIHANSSKENSASGIETFFLDYGLFESETDSSYPPKMLANSAQKSPSNDWSLDMLVRSALNKRTKESKKFAQLIQMNVVSHARTMECVIDRKVKSAVAQVLLGVAIPAALVEIGFLSNRDEATRLTQPTYQKLLAEGIAEGICSYLKIMRS